MKEAEPSEPLGWTEIRVTAPSEWAELVADTLRSGPFGSVLIGRGDADPELPPGHDLVRASWPAREDGPARREALRRALAELARTAGVPELEGLVPTFHELAARDWASLWRESWRPFRVGRLCVVPPGDGRPLRRGDVRLCLAPGGVFGTGRHATTRAVLRVIQARLRPGERVLDAGTGSGILAVAAALLGAGAVLGFDVDPGSAPAAAHLARENGVAARCAFRTGGFDVLEPPAEVLPFDAVLANLYADAVQAHAAGLAARLRPGGWFAVSGIERRHGSATRAALAAAGLEVEEETSQGRWRTFAGRRRVGA